MLWILSIDFVFVHQTISLGSKKPLLLSEKSFQQNIVTISGKRKRWNMKCTAMSWAYYPWMYVGIGELFQCFSCAQSPFVFVSPRCLHLMSGTKAHILTWKEDVRNAQTKQKSYLVGVATKTKIINKKQNETHICFVLCGSFPNRRIILIKNKNTIILNCFICCWFTGF